MGEVDNASDCATFGSSVKAFHACSESTTGIGIELALRPEGGVPVGCYRSQPVKRPSSLNAKSNAQAPASNAECGRPGISWTRQAACFASSLSACSWQY